MPSFRETWPDLLAFAIGLGLARFFRWQARDLVWTLWLGSLVLGYLTILATIAGGVVAILHSLSTSETDPKSKMALLAMTVGGGLFLLVFFSLHFCGFHAGHATFLALFFPLPDITAPKIMVTFVNPLRLWAFAFRSVIPHYGYFLIPALMAERHHLLKSLRAVAPRVPNERPAFLVELFNPSDSPKPNNVPDPFFAPYKNVVRMHFLIFFFAFAHFLKLDSFLVYAVIYAAYFFPWQALRHSPIPTAEKTPCSTP